MKKLFIFILFALCSCSITPEIVSKDNHKTSISVSGDKTAQNSEWGWGWILWYIPACAVTLLWAKREFGKPKPSKQKDTSSSS